MPAVEHPEGRLALDRPQRGLQFDAERLVGCNSVGWTEHIGVMRGLVEGRVRLGHWKQRLLDDPTLLMQAYLACAQAQEARSSLRH